MSGLGRYNKLDAIARPGTGVVLDHEFDTVTGSYLVTVRSFAHRVCTEACAEGYEVREGLRNLRGNRTKVGRRNRKLDRVLAQIQAALKEISVS